jgi:hypothetical protein
MPLQKSIPVVQQLLQPLLGIDQRQLNSDTAAALMPPLGSSMWLLYNNSTAVFEPSNDSTQIACPVCQSIVITDIADESLAVCEGAYLLQTYKRRGNSSIIQWAHTSRPCVFLYDTTMLKWYVRLEAQRLIENDDTEPVLHIAMEAQMIIVTQ